MGTGKKLVIELPQPPTFEAYTEQGSRVFQGMGSEASVVWELHHSKE